MPHLRDPIELGRAPSAARRFARTTGLVVVAVALFVLALAIIVVATTD